MIKESVLANALEWDDLTEIEGIGQGTQKILRENGIKNKETLLSLPIEEVKKTITNPLSLKGVLNFITKNKEWEILKTSDSKTEKK